MLIIQCKLERVIIMGKNRNLLYIVIINVVLLTFVFSVIKLNNIEFDKNLILVNANAELSNKKVCWGIKRAKDHAQPDVGASNKSVLEKYGGMCLGKSDSKKIYLTFDAGYEAGYMEKILEVLKKNEVKACFFITAHYLNTQPELVKKMIDEGHVVGNHTVNHKSMSEISNETIQTEVMNLHTAIYDKFGYEMKYIRPPKGEFSQRTLEYTKSLGYTTVMWSLAYDDWDEGKQGREEYGKSKVIENLHNGAIILLHSNSKDNSNILNDVIIEAKNMGYEFESLEKFE